MKLKQHEFERCMWIEEVQYTCFQFLSICPANTCQVPPDGEFPVMNYRMTQEFKPPFRINTLIEEAGALKVIIFLHTKLYLTMKITWLERINYSDITTHALVKRHVFHFCSFSFDSSSLEPN